MASSDLILVAQKLVSVPSPFIDDQFVADNHVKILFSDADKYIRSFQESSLQNHLIASILDVLTSNSDPDPLQVFDIGVFMGSFSNTVAAIADYRNLHCNIQAFEANPELICGILQNFNIHNTIAHLNWLAVGADFDRLSFMVSEGASIGGRIRLESKSSDDSANYYSVPVVPLRHILETHAKPGLVKIDIEGHEVPAFSSIVNSPNSLNNIFIVEYSPWQYEQVLADGLTYGEFLLENYDIYNAGCWGWHVSTETITDEAGLRAIRLGNANTNTDLVLVPKVLGVSSNDLIK